ncbi:unnamed protein product [Rotaria sp. Silwood1]|nr:unnamed protein product [Rotaria sp. Silwood1]
MSTPRVLVDKNTGKKHCIDGLIESKHKSEDEKLRQTFGDHTKLNASQLLPKVDLRSGMPPIKHQERVDSCVGNAMAEAYEYLLKKRSRNGIDVSRLFIHYNARVRGKFADGKIIDKGSIIPYIIEVLKQFSTCLKSMWPYDIRKVNERPSDEAYEAAKNNWMTDLLRLKVDLNEMKTCLTQEYPLIFGVKTFGFRHKVKENGIVPMPKPGESQSKDHRRNATLAIDYRHHLKTFIVQNSWRNDWGDKRYCYNPYDYMTDDDFCFQGLAVRQVETDDIDYEHWIYDDSIDYQPDNVDEEKPNEQEEQNNQDNQ